MRSIAEYMYSQKTFQMIILWHAYQSWELVGDEETQYISPVTLGRGIINKEYEKTKMYVSHIG